MQRKFYLICANLLWTLLEHYKIRLHDSGHCIHTALGLTPCHALPSSQWQRIMQQIYGLHRQNLPKQTLKRQCVSAMTLISAMMTSPQLVEGKMKTVLVQQKKNEKKQKGKGQIEWTNSGFGLCVLLLARYCLPSISETACILHHNLTNSRVARSAISKHARLC